MTHSDFLPVARHELQKLGFAVEEIPTQVSRQQKTPDFNVIGKSSRYLVELKVKGDDPAEVEQNRRELEAGKIVMKSTPTGPKSRMENIICDGSDRGQFRQSYGSGFAFLMAGLLAIVGLAVAVYLAVIL
jgi:hypothetical protein